MVDVNHFHLTKTKTYTGNESSMIRTQLDNDIFGNGDGYLHESEANAFIASYNDYFEETRLIVMDDSYVIKENASVLAFNLVGSTSDTTSNITTRFTFDARPISLPSQRQYYFQFKEELWTYLDLNGVEHATVDNNLTIRAPEGWRIVYTAGLLNEVYEEDKRIMRANANLDFETISVKISTIANVENGDNEAFDQDILIYIAIIGVIVALIVAFALLRRYGVRTSEYAVVPISEAERQELLLQKREMQENLITVRRELRNDRITKDEARSREKTIKERLREIDKKISQTKVQKGTVEE